MSLKAKFSVHFKTSISFNAVITGAPKGVAEGVTYRCDISKHWTLKCPLDLSTVSLFLPHNVFPVQICHNKTSVQHRQLSWRCLNSKIQDEKSNK